MALSDISLIEERPLKDGYVLRIERDDWGKFIRIVDGDRKTVFGKLIIEEAELEFQIQQAIAGLK